MYISDYIYIYIDRLYYISTYIFFSCFFVVVSELNIIQMDGFRTIMNSWKRVVICCNPLEFTKPKTVCFFDLF